MIWDSTPYQNECLKAAEQLRAWTHARRLTGASFLKIEKTLFFAFYTVRKLVEAHKLCDRTAHMKVKTTTSKNRKAVTVMNWHRIDELYDAADFQYEEVDLSFVYNQIIHSYVFMPSLNESGGLQSIYVSSDRYRNVKLHRFEVNDLVQVLESVGNDEVVESKRIFDKKIGDYRVSNS